MKRKNIVIKITFLIVCLTTGLFLNAQEEETIDIPLSNPNASGKLVFHVTKGSIKVSGYEGKDVVVTASNKTFDSDNRKSKKKYKHKEKFGKKSTTGMKRITDNSMSFTVEEIDNTVRIRKSVNSDTNFEVKVPRNFSVDIKTVNDSSIYVENVVGTHEVSNTNGFITMQNVSGSVIADALNQGMIISFESIDENATMMFSSLNGDIDITFPSNLKADISARSDNGDIFTDFDIVKNNNNQNIKTSNSSGVYKVKREKGIFGTINGGGAELTFKTLNGDVLIRAN